jgi:hypothetical protein
VANLAFEHLGMALEATRGTAIAAPTHLLPWRGKVTPRMEHYRPDESRGHLAEYHRSRIVKRWSEWEAEGDLDARAFPLLLELAARGGVTATQPDAVGAPSTYLWTYAPVLTADNLKTATLWWGDPNVQIWRVAFATVDEIIVDSDATGEAAPRVRIRGHAAYPEAVDAPDWPSVVAGPLLAASEMSVWLDTSSSIGTTAVEGRVISARHTIRTNLIYKWLAAGPGSGLGYSALGRKKRHITTRVVMELPNTAQFDVFSNGQVGRLRVRYNGPLIEDTRYHYAQVDTWGPFDSLDWGEFEGANRTIELTMYSEYHAEAAVDWRAQAQNNSNAI